MINLPDPIFITRGDALIQLADALAREPVVAVDTESNSLYAYREQVCLIQFSTSKVDYLVDTLALDDLSPLAPLFSSQEIEKVFHAAEYDVLCLKRDFGFNFNNLFDTMVAARILGREAVGLGSMLAEVFSIRVEKRYQRANWGQRPLPLHLLSYAQIDTHYLIGLRNRLHAELKDKNLWPLAAEDFKRLQDVNGRAVDKKAACWRINGAYDLPPQRAAVLLELCRYRDKVARSINRPLFKVMGDRTLFTIAADGPSSLNELKRLPGMSPRQVKRHGKAVLSAVRRGLQAKPITPPRTPHPGEEYINRFETLRSWRKTAAQRMGVMSDIVLPRDLLGDIANRNPRRPKDLAVILSDVPWRMERFGEQILDALSKT